MRQSICYIDVGGTFTDCFVMDEEGGFKLAKAPSTPGNISTGFFNSLDKVAKELGMETKEMLSGLEVLGFGATLVVNALLTRTGRKCGMITTKGFEDIFEIGRGKAGWYHLTSEEDKLHVQMHEKLPPLIPRYLVRGVFEGVDSIGEVIIPVHEEEARLAAEDLLREGVEAIVVLTINDVMNDENERRIAEIVRGIAGDKIDVLEGVKVCPIIREWPRACTVAIEAYTAALLRRAVTGIANRAKEMGFKRDILMMQSTGGVATAESTVAVNTVQSGPVGGLIGGRFIANLYGYKNVVTSDVGGTSFDVGLVTGGEFNLNREPGVLNMVLAVPIAQVISIGSGGGTIASVDPLTGSLQVGPASAGANPGPASYGLGGELPTVTDADLVLGYFDPDYFLGGALKLHRELAHEAIGKHVAMPLGIGVTEAARAIRAIVDASMREALNGQLLGRGFDPRDFVLLAFGGAGASHVEGYTKGLRFKEIMVFPFSSVFSAFGAASADIERTRTRSVGVVIPPNATDDEKMAKGKVVNEAWEEAEEWTLSQLQNDGIPREKANIRRTVSMRYGRQLNDIVVESPISQIKSARDVDALIEAFEREYVKLYSMSAKFARAGYEIYDVSVSCSYPKLKPTLIEHELGPKIPSKKCIKGVRKAYFGKQFTEVRVYDMAKLEAGFEIPGPCIIESSTTTFVIPEDSWVEVDRYLTMKLKRRDPGCSDK